MAVARRSGTQAVERAIALVRIMAERNIGWKISALAEFCGLDIGTTHRLLSCLVRERIVQQRAADRRYVLGPLISELALSHPLQPDFREPFHAVMAPVAKKANAASFLYLRSGSEYVVAAQTGAPASNALVGKLGSRRPLAWTAGGVAIILAMPKEEARAVTRENLKKIKAYGDVRLDWTKRMLRESRELGFAINTVNVTGIHLYAVAVLDGGCKPVAAISLAVSAQEVPPDKASSLVATLKDAAARIALDTASKSQSRADSAPAGIAPGAASAREESARLAGAKKRSR